MHRKAASRRPLAAGQFAGIRHRYSAAAIALILLAVGAAACGITMSSDPEPRDSYLLVVQNRLAEDMIVTYDDGRGTRLLGTVTAGDSQRFTIVNPARTSIRVEATDTERRQVVRRTVTLDLETAVTVELSAPGELRQPIAAPGSPS